MNPRIKALWVEALRSGNYKQTQSALKRGDGFCCLGVLCDLHAKETNGEWVNTGAFEGGPEYFHYFRDEAVLPLEVCEWAGIDWHETGRVIRLKNPDKIRGYYSLASMNDTGCGFDEIANEIEKEL